MNLPSVNQAIQTITLVLSDGRRVSYHGLPQIDHLFPVRVTEILVSRSRLLPEGMSWETITPPEIKDDDRA